MNKNDLVVAMATEMETTQKEAKVVLDALIEVITEELSNGGEIVLTGFGKFSVTKKKAYVARNPKDGNPVNVPAKLAPKFKFSKVFADSIK